MHIQASLATTPSCGGNFAFSVSKKLSVVLRHDQILKEIVMVMMLLTLRVTTQLVVEMHSGRRFHQRRVIVIRGHNVGVYGIRRLLLLSLAVAQCLQRRRGRQRDNILSAASFGDQAAASLMPLLLSEMLRKVRMVLDVVDRDTFRFVDLQHLVQQRLRDAVDIMVATPSLQDGHAIIALDHRKMVVVG